MQARAGGTGRLQVDGCSLLRPSTAIWANCVGRMPPRTPCGTTPRTFSEFLTYLTPPEGPPPAPTKFDVLLIREWMAHLYELNLTTVSIRRKLAAVRSLLRFLLREGVVDKNVARLVRTPKAPKTLPRVPTEEQTNALLDAVAAGKLERPFPRRDVAIFELLYGCGLRISELCGLNWRIAIFLALGPRARKRQERTADSRTEAKRRRRWNSIWASDSAAAGERPPCL